MTGTRYPPFIPVLCLISDADYELSKESSIHPQLAYPASESRFSNDEDEFVNHLEELGCVTCVSSSHEAQLLSCDDNHEVESATATSSSHSFSDHLITP